MIQRKSLDTLAAAWAQIMGIPAPECANTANPDLLAFANQAFSGEKADRVFLYNPDAIGQWLCEKYPEMLSEVTDRTELTLPLHSPMPPKTPVCFGTMYTGAQPEVHGIQKYEKPRITIDTLFDALLRAGKRPVIIAYAAASMGLIFNGRDMDYYVFDNISQVNAKAAQLILEDQHDFYAIYKLRQIGSRIRSRRSAYPWRITDQCPYLRNLLRNDPHPLAPPQNPYGVLSRPRLSPRPPRQRLSRIGYPRRPGNLPLLYRIFRIIVIRSVIFMHGITIDNSLLQ